MEKKVILITGASSGIGFDTARLERLRQMIDEETEIKEIFEFYSPYS